MNEQEFISELTKALSSLPLDQREDILGEYRSHFFEGKERGKSEEDIAKAFGDPKGIARTYVADYHFEQWQTPTKGQGVGKSFYHLGSGLIIMFSLLFFNFFFILWPVLIFAFILCVGWFLFGILTFLGGVFAIVSLFGGASELVLPNVSTQFALFFYSLGTALVGSIGLVALYTISRLSINGIQKYIRLNINLVTA